MEVNNDSTDISKPFSGFSRDNLDYILARSSAESRDILNFFKQKYAAEYTAGAGVWEGYTIEQHTAMVMAQYDKYFGKVELPLAINPNFFKIILSLHDIGKPEAIRSGGKHLQHLYTSRLISQTLSELGFNQRETDIATALVSDDCIGNCVKGGDLEQSAQRIRALAKERDLPPKELFELMLILYKVDAGSYTEDAGGLHSLDSLFVFDGKNKRMDLSSTPLEIVDRLRLLIN